MKKFPFLIGFLSFMSTLTFCQKTKQVDLSTSIYNVLFESNIKIKDSLIIYALNFQLEIIKNGEKTLVNQITANDSLAFTLFPSYKKLKSINFTSLMNGRKKIRLIIPILIYGSSSGEKKHLDSEGRPLINLESAANAAYSLYSPSKFNNLHNANLNLLHRLYQQNKVFKEEAFWEATTMNPIVYEIGNIK
ncbi:hypothetical protein [Pedobacter frigiditerrae]|uniref:hypothetical protein n=1 Tax=Pedobacter frigiditerrae TaxID=2530452 RepID=UPI00292CFA4C|nr:hypothetical protein [Pedobacter frigiditerrae]